MYGAQSNKRDFESAMGSFSDHNNSVQKPPMNYYQGMMPSSAPMGGYFYSPQAMNGYPVNQQSMGPQVDTPGGQSVLGHPPGMPQPSMEPMPQLRMGNQPSIPYHPQLDSGMHAMGLPGYDPASIPLSNANLMHSGPGHGMAGHSMGKVKSTKMKSDADWALEKRRARNRITAAESRRKCKEEVQNLRDEVKRMKEEKKEKEAIIEYYRNRYERFETTTTTDASVVSKDESNDEKNVSSEEGNISDAGKSTASLVSVPEIQQPEESFVDAAKKWSANDTAREGQEES